MFSTTALIAALALAATGETSDNWPQFRGPDGQGHSQATNLPVSWSETEHITWKTALPGEAWSSPVVFGNQIWLTTAVDSGKSLRALCVDRQTGKLLHDVEVFQIEQPENVNAQNSYASPSPVIEAGRVYVHFGTNGTACLATDTASILWKNDQLHLEHKEGPGSSPILFENLVIFSCDGMDVQFVVALDKRTGQVAWKTTRSGKMADNPDWRKAYSTPLVIDTAKGPLLVSTAADQVVAYEPRTGAERWKVRYKGFSVVPRPIFDHGLVYVVTDFARPQLWAIAPDGKGDITEKHVKWQANKQIGSASSPLLVGSEIYLITTRGVASCVDAHTGEVNWVERLGGNFWASPTSADGRVYIFGESGKSYTLAPGKEYKLLAESQLDGRQMASPAICGSAIYLRTHTHLYRIEKRDRRSAQR